MMLPDGNLQTVKNGFWQYGYTTTYVYNAAGETTSEVSPVTTYDPTVTPHPADITITQTWQYDALGDLLSSTDGNSNTTTYTYTLSAKC